MNYEERIEAKLNALAKAIGGPVLKEAWEQAEADLPKRQRTFERARCGCWKGDRHLRTCPKFDPREARGNVA